MTVMAKHRKYEKIIDLHQFTIPTNKGNKKVIEVKFIDAICKDYHSRKLKEEYAYIKT